MPRPRRRLWSVLVAHGLAWATLAPACRVFDEQLYLRALDGRADAEPNAAHGSDGAALVALGERCGAGVPRVASSASAWAASTMSLMDDVRDLASCAGAELRGPDGFFAISAKQGEKWHVHVDTRSATADPAIYLLSSCDPRTCQAGLGADGCGPGKAEHLSFFAPATQVYYVGVDSKAAEGAGIFDVTVLRPVCGNGGAPEHSETCDDGNTTPGDGCDEQCRKEMARPGERELEPNDDAGAANLLLLGGTPGKSLWALGAVTSACDTDLYAVKLSAGEVLRARLASPGAPSCLAGLRLDVINRDGVVLGAGALGDDGCPALPELAGQGGTEVYLRVTAMTQSPLDYRLNVEMP
jgi:cysteine-rich repeat protein